MEGGTDGRIEHSENFLLVAPCHFLPFTFTSRYKIVPIKKLYKKIKL